MSDDYKYMMMAIENSDIILITDEIRIKLIQETPEDVNSGQRKIMHKKFNPRCFIYNKYGRMLKDCKVQKIIASSSTSK